MQQAYSSDEHCNNHADYRRDDHHKWDDCLGTGGNGIGTGAGIAHFAGSTQAVTSSPVALATEVLATSA